LEFAVPHFRFHFRYGEAVEVDPEGFDLPDLRAAKIEALESARHLVSEAVRFANDAVPDAIVIESEEGRELLTVPVTDVLPKPLRK
jgi:hypothetical protein